MSVVTVTISSEGERMPEEFELLWLEAFNEVNRIPRATLCLLDGEAASQRFMISDMAFFEPGKKIEIKLRYEGMPESEVSIFVGVVMRHTVEASERGCLLTVEAKDAAIKMTRVRKSCVYYGKTDSEIIGILLENSDLTKSALASSTVEHDEITQYYCSDWDFMLARANANGLLVAVSNGAVSLAKIAVSSQIKHSFEFGISEIYEFEMEVDANHRTSRGRPP